VSAHCITNESMVNIWNETSGTGTDLVNDIFTLRLNCVLKYEVCTSISYDRKIVFMFDDLDAIIK